MNELGNSRKVISNQVGLNEQLETVVRKHLSTDFKKPYQEHTLAAFNTLAKQLAGDSRPIIFDSCCGVGESTVKIAQLHPEAVVIGLDKSAHRLAKTPISLPDNAVLLQVDLNDFWRLAVEAGWQLSHHYLLYPNPWPKAKHFQRRWHGSSVFPYILKLGGKLEVRSNWQTYVDEFAASLAIAGFDTKVEQYQSDEAITPFERKYWASGQDSWRLQLNL
ncbi:SAM-dependent methyltransferase [Motilimonas cestriensis]|uniref:tRNA (guanine(46)-N(7))-methyltransferase n=1 Tax=Motilimonas cestriensis TaxID=2742685 RepID=A0ABS8WE02_9GAMM|nr:SAM-dependent methyltransferase [Motilimonas cestriensis]MCE2596498.1 SAM-dependent methyltransferase [Motilimonas cestriensis]